VAERANRHADEFSEAQVTGYRPGEGTAVTS